MTQFKTVLGSAAIAAIALTVVHPLVAGAIPQKSRSACIQRTAEEMGVSVFNVRITSVGPVSAESGATTLKLENPKTGQTAECRVNTIDNTVLSVQLTGSSSSGSSSSTTPKSGSFSGKGTAKDSVFGKTGQSADASLDFNNGRFSLNVYVPPGTGAQLQYQGSINRITAQNPNNPNSFVIDGRISSFASSANNLQTVNTSGSCRIEVADARIISAYCSTLTSGGSLRFVGMKEF